MSSFRIGDRVSYTYEDRHGNEGHDTGRVVGVDPAAGTVSIWWDWSNEATSEDIDDPDIIITGRSDLRAIGVVVAMVAAGHTKTALYRQTLRCYSNPHDEVQELKDQLETADYDLIEARQDLEEARRKLAEVDG